MVFITCLASKELAIFGRELPSLRLFIWRNSMVRKLLIKTYSAFHMIFPFLMASIFALIFILFGFEDTELCRHFGRKVFINSFFNKVTSIIIFVVLIYFIFLLFKLVLKISSKISIKRLLFIIFIICFVSRILLLLINLGQIKPFSDFALEWNRANGDNSFYIQQFCNPTSYNYSVFLKIISFIFFGKFTGVLITDAFLNSISSIFIFLIISFITSKNEYSLFGAFGYIFNPSQIVYTLITTPEHLSITLFLIATYLILLSYKKNNYILLIFSAVIGGLSQSIKPFFQIIIVAYIIALILFDNSTIKNKIFRISFSIGILFGISYIIQFIFTKITEIIFGVKFLKGTNAHFLCVGLNRQGEGQIHLGNLSRTFHNYIKKGVKPEIATRRTYKAIIKDWKGNEADIFPFFIKKMMWGWQDDLVPMQYYLGSIGLQPNSLIQKGMYNFIKIFGGFISELHYSTMMLLGTFASFSFFCNNEKYSFYTFFIGLITFGYFCLIVLSEAQSRYKCLCIPFIIIFISCSGVIDRLIKNND